MSDRLSRAEAIFHQVAGAPAAQRESMLSELSSGDEMLRALVARLLIHDDAGMPGFLECPAVIEDDPAAHIAPGDVLSNRYRIECFLARGGMGDVFRAFDGELGAPVALKTIRPDIARGPHALDRIRREILIARSISHPNVCRTYDLGRDAARDMSFLTMEYLAGETLSARLRRAGPLVKETAMVIVQQVAEALDAAHRAGVVHRDLKSSNVMLVPGNEAERVVITDFGLAALVTGPKSEDVVRPSHSLAGTPAYMSPEQVKGESIGPATDFYALGVVLFEMVTGRLPFEASTPWETARARLLADPPSPSRFGKVDAAWERAILRLLSRDPERRYSSGRDLMSALEGRHTAQPPSNYSLAPERDTFVGRTIELAWLRERLQPEGVPPSRLVTILGTGGVGKTRLAQHYGWESLPRWPGGVWFCDLSEVRTLDGIASAVAMSLNVPLRGDDPVVHLGHAMAARDRCLVILDSVEQVTALSVPAIVAWRQRCSETSFLVTSRERLGLKGESVLVLEPLDPDTDGLALFESRARASRPGFRLEETDRCLVRQVMTRLDGLPLAIELAASRLGELSLDQLRERLEDRFQVLTGGKRGRHSTLRTTLDSSWELLPPWERSAMAQLSVFEGAFTLEAGEAVMDLSAYAETPPVLDVIQALVDKSWLRANTTLDDLRFEMCATIREYVTLTSRRI